MARSQLDRLAVELAGMCSIRSLVACLLGRWRSHGPDALAVVALLGVILWHLLPGVTATRFHRDEARWIGRVSLLREWRHPLGPRWQDEAYPDRYGTTDERHRMRSQPPLAAYVLGAGLLVQGRNLSTNGFWIMTRGVSWNRDRGNMPSPDDLRTARRTNVAVAALTAGALLAIGTRLTNRVGGAVGALVFAVHPLTRETATHAWADPLLGLLVALTAVAAYRLADRPTWGRGLALGVLLGFGGATKLSPLVLSVVLAGLGVALLAVGRWRRSAAGTGNRDRLALSLVAAPFVAFAVFVACYPYLWPNPVGHTFHMFTFRTASFNAQAQNVPSAAVPTRADAFRRVGAELGSNYSVVGAIAGWIDHRLGTHKGERGGLGGIDLAVAIVGGELALAALAKRGPRGADALVALVLGGEAAVIVLSMGVEYARYLYPVMVAETVAVGIVAGTCWRVLRGGAADARLSGAVET